MKRTSDEINQVIARQIVETMFTLFSEFGGRWFGTVGAHFLCSDQLHVISIGDADPVLEREVESYLATFETRIDRTDALKLHNGTPHSIAGVILQDGEVPECHSVFACYSPLGDPYNLAVAAIYGHYHRLARRTQVFDETFVDTLLLQLGQWQSDHAHDNDVVVLLAQRVFKPEMITQ